MQYIKKGIFEQPGKKIQGTRQGKLFLCAENENKELFDLSWKDYKALNVPENLSREKEFIQALLSQLSNFGQKVDFNRYCKETNASFHDKVDWLLKAGAKYTKKGLKN